MSDVFCPKCGAAFEEGDKFCSKCGTKRDVVPQAVQVKGGAFTLSLSIFLGVAGVVVAMFMVFGLGGGGLFGSSVEGALTVKGGPHGAFRFVPTGCQSMQPFGRAGANLHGDGPNDGGVYVTADPLQGTRVDVEVPGSCRNADGTDCTVFEVPRDHCPRFEVDVEFTGTVINDVRQYQGHTRLTCVLDDGTSIDADLVYDGC